VASCANSKQSINCVPQFYTGGQCIGLASEYVHLEHILSARLDDKNDILTKRNSLRGKITMCCVISGNVINLSNLATAIVL